MELALEHARGIVAAAVAVAATPSGIPDAESVTLATLADASLRRANRVQYANDRGNDGRRPLDFGLRLSLLASELTEHGLRPDDSSAILRSTYQTLPDDSLLRAEAAWRYARATRKTSRYLIGDEDLELAIPLWRRLGLTERAATAAWWIAERAITSTKRARGNAELALALFRQLGDAAHAGEVEAWLAAHPED